MEAAAYYRRRIAHFEAERDIFAHYAGMVQPSQMETHLLQWECAQQEEDIRSLQSEIAQVHHAAKLAVIEQAAREQELAELQHTRTGRRHRIQRLLAMCQPAQKDRTVVLDAKWPNNKGVWSSQVQFTRGAAMAAVSADGEDSHLNHTLSDLADKIEQHRQQLLAELQNMERYYNGTEQTTSLRIQALSQDTQRFIDKLFNTEQQHFDTVKDLLRLRLQVQVAQRVDVDLKEHCKHAMLEFEKEQASVLQQYNSDSAALKENAATDAQDSVKELQRQMNALTQRAADLKLQAESSTAEQEEKIAKLSEQLQATKDRFHKLHYRHELEVQGYAAETRLLQNRMRQIRRFNNI